MTLLRVVLLVLLPLQAMAAIDVYQFENEQQEARFRVLAEELRCPKCQNQSIADSDAELAQDMRDRVHSMILEGKSDAEIVDYFRSRFGDFVSYRPPVNAQTSVLWLIPLLMLLGGGTLIIFLLRKASARADENDSNQGDAP
ncbi:cytochrome c-type biogenesis protein CcmH [Alcanivorax sp. S6407]|uniref:cytochrome c-type biogenesis protein n=1 Tax=Alcanivorax sp. S6407 TaxID=2926424 RepID=UPI001FF202F6|nr:cytochrome c-type biogenesis protein [Alcanivorax sp. S6407]MCK0153007.1 cytochrome c-type biogenesis protein CcmH [Alcanivorax sp. S6407]